MTAAAPTPLASAGGGEARAAAVRAARPPAVPHPRWLRAAVLMGAVVGMADATLVAIALVPLGRQFGQPLAATQQVITLYLVTVTASLPLLGRLGDRLGRREVYAAGFVVFALGSGLAALAPSYGVLLGARAVQAVGGGVLTSGSLALVAQFAPARTAGRSIALLVIAQATAGLVAPPLGGAIVAIWNWQAVFWLGVPVGLVGLGITLWAVPRQAPPSRRGGIDPVGSLGLGALLLGAGSAVSALSGAEVGGLGLAPWATVAAAGLMLLVLAEPRVAHPLLERRLLRGRFGLAALATMVSTGALMSCFALLPFWLEAAHGASAALAGAAFLPIGIGIALTSRRAGRRGDAGETRGTTVTGMLVAAGGLCLAALAASTDAWWLLVVGLAVLGAGNGLFSSPNTAAAMSVASRAALGSAAGLLSTARNAGVVLGIGTVGAVWTVATRGQGSGRADTVAAAVLVAAALLCLAVAGLASRTYRGAAAPGTAS